MATREKDAARPFFISVPVWGQEYVRVFLNYSLPAQLAPGNIPALPNAENSRYLIFTTSDHAEQIRQSPAFQQLAKSVPADIRTFELQKFDPSEPANWGKRYEIKSDCYRIALAEAEKADAVNVLLNADIILADGFMRRAAEIIAAGKRVIEVVGPRTLKPPVAEALDSMRDSTGAITVSPRALTRLAVKHLHPMAQMHLWETDIEAFHPSHIYFKVGETSLLARCLHTYPIVIYPRTRGSTFTDSIDKDLTESACPDFNDTYLPLDTDEISCCELSDAEHYVGAMFRRPIKIQDIANFYDAYGSPRSRLLFANSIRLPGGDEPQSSWDRAGDLSSQLVKAFEDELLARKKAEQAARQEARRQRLVSWVPSIIVRIARRGMRVLKRLLGLSKA